MTTLYIQQQGTHVYKRDNQVIVSKDGQKLEDLPLAKLDQVVLMGRGVQISTALLIDLIERGIPVTFTNQRGSRHYFTAAPSPSRFGELRTRQMYFVHSPTQALELARAIILAKLTNQASLLRNTGWPAAATAIVQINAAIRSAQDSPNIDVLRGYEGAGAAAYFGAWRAALPVAWGFQGRAFYPPPDAVNAMLSFGYTLALNDMLHAVQITGLDPYLGTFHAVEAGRPSLALDLMEEFRPMVVDRLVLDMMQSGNLGRERFERPAERQDAIYLDQAGRAIFVDRYELLMQSRVPVRPHEQTTLRRAFLLQAQAVARVMRGEQERYTAFGI